MRFFGSQLGVLLASLLVSCALTAPQEGRREAFDYTVVDRMVSGSGESSLHVRVLARDAQAGRYISILPSLGRGVEDYTEQYGSTIVTRLVEAGHRVVLVQPRGFGRSRGGLTPERVTMQLLAADLAAAFEALGIERLSLVGHAFGNRVARTFATLHPERVEDLVLMASGGGFALNDAQVECLQGSLDFSLPAEERLEWIRCAFFAEGNDPRVWLDGWSPQLAAAQAHAAVSIEPGFFERAGGLPFLLLQPAEDFVAPPEQAGRVLRDRLGDQVTYVEIPGAGHALSPERPELTARLILDHLARTRSR